VSVDLEPMRTTSVLLLFNLRTSDIWFTAAVSSSSFSSPSSVALSEGLSCGRPSRSSLWLSYGCIFSKKSSVDTHSMGPHLPVVGGYPSSWELQTGHLLPLHCRTFQVNINKLVASMSFNFWFITSIINAFFCLSLPPLMFKDPKLKLGIERSEDRRRLNKRNKQKKEYPV